MRVPKQSASVVREQDTALREHAEKHNGISPSVDGQFCPDGSFASCPPPQPGMSCQCQCYSTNPQAYCANYYV